MTSWYVALGICAAFMLFAHFKWRQERKGMVELRVIGSYGPYATGLTLMTLIIALRIVLHN
jgi:hypothetical protein